MCDPGVHHSRPASYDVDLEKYPEWDYCPNVMGFSDRNVCRIFYTAADDTYIEFHKLLYRAQIQRGNRLLFRRSYGE